MPFIISIDPGEKYTGICLFEYTEGETGANLMLKKKLTSKEEYFQVLRVAVSYAQVSRITHVACENFRVRDEKDAGRHSFNPRAHSSPANMFKWSEVPTIRAVGQAEIFAFWIGAEFVLQEPGNVLPMGRKWCDFPCPQNPKTHIADDISAYIHGCHLMMKLKIIRGVKDVTKFGQSSIPEV